jgi:hypothetical protein
MVKPALKKGETPEPMVLSIKEKNNIEFHNKCKIVAGMLQKATSSIIPEKTRESDDDLDDSSMSGPPVLLA